MMEVVTTDGQPLIARSLAMQLRQAGLRTLESLLDQGRTNTLLEILGHKEIGRQRIARIRQAANQARLERTESHKDRIVARLPDCSALIAAYFSASGTTFEDRLNDCFFCLELNVLRRDDGAVPRFPDFVVEIDTGTTIVIECKSNLNGKGVNLGDATDVGSKATAHGLDACHKVTVCQPYVSSDVPRLIESASNLSVVNSEDMAAAMAYLKAGTISKERFVTWLLAPGQPRGEELFQG
jgi:hypothetical protein